MILRFLPAIAFVAAISCAISANFVFFAMIGEVNRRRPSNNQIRYFLMLPDTYFTVWKEYKLGYPKGALATALITLLVVFIALMLFAFISFVQMLPHLVK